MNQLKLLRFLPLLLLFLLGNCDSNRRPAFQKEPLDDLIKEYASVKQYAINLYDMDYREAEDKYYHQYQILYTNNPEDTLLEKTTGWLPVSPTFFNKHLENMGMTLVRKTDGTVEKTVTPPGYDQYVGNEKYGHWQQGSGGGSFWAFYGQYAFLSSMLNMGGPISRGGYYDYRRNYAPQGRTYYGGSGANRTYGTGGSHTSIASGNTWMRKSSSFKQNVRSRVSRSASRTKRSRSSSRYRSSSSMRSRGGGFGK